MAGEVRRSWLLTPVSDEEIFRQALTCGADVIVLDLVELVHERDKPQARERVKDAIGVASRGGAEVFVQVDKELLYADLEASVWPGLTGVVLPRLESVQEMVEAERLISQIEEGHGLLPGTVQVVLSMETARGNLWAIDIARATPRLWGITLGRADLVMDLRPEPSGEIHLMSYLMQRLIIIANAVGSVPIGAWWRAPARGLLASPEDTHQAAVRGRHIGFKGSFCIRPDQVEPLNRGFTPQPAEVEQAKHLVEAFTEAEKSGRTVLQLGDRIVDLPTVKQARQLLAYAEACAKKDAEKAQARARDDKQN